MSHSGSNSGKIVTGAVPCGNPKRYGSRDVVKMHNHKGEKRALEEEDGHKTEGERHVKTLLDKQIRKDITLKQQFSNHRDFTPATSHAPEVERLQGVYQYDDYKSVESLDSRIDELRHCGLTDEEIALKMSQDMKDEIPAVQRGYGTDPEIKLSRLREIEKKIKEKKSMLSKPDSFKGALELSRQEMDIDKSLILKRQREADNQVVIATQKKFAETHPDDPVNHIPKMISELEGKVERESRRDRRRKRKIERKMKYYQQFENKDSSFGSDEEDRKVNEQRLDDARLEMRESTIAGSRDDVTTLSSGKTCCHLAESLATHTGHLNEEVRVRQVLPSQPFLSKQEILANRLSLKEIHQIDKFKNYDAGQPSKILYVKNLSNETKEEDLLSLFGLFQSVNEPKIIFKLLTGRMKGQAFITFPDEETSGQAIDLVNGYKLNGKPVILSYGRSQT